MTFTGVTSYPTRVPFDPPEAYPEHPGAGLDTGNAVYAGVRDALHRLGLDHDNFGTAGWNPLGSVVKPGMTVLVKPNTVRHVHIRGLSVLSLIVHASVLRPLLDYVCIALENRGKIVVGDSQLLFGRFDEAMEASQIGPLLEWYRSRTEVAIECFDLRTKRAVRTWLGGEWGRARVEADPHGYKWVNLGDASTFAGIDPRILRIGVADRREMLAHHSNGRHEYLLPGSVLRSDAVISVPKLKTHRRAGVTLALKNFMGLPAGKESLPHFLIGSPEEGGDQYPYRSRRKAVHTWLNDKLHETGLVPVQFLFAVGKKAVWGTRRIVPFQDNVDEAMWHGNDTMWRTLIDLHRAVFYSDEEGNLHDTPQRTHFCLIDGIVGGEKNGPLDPDPVASGVLVAGLRPTVVDAVAASLMGFDIERIPTIAKALVAVEGIEGGVEEARDGIEVAVGARTLSLREFEDAYNLGFEPHPGWKGHMERRPPAQSAASEVGAP